MRRPAPRPLAQALSALTAGLAPDSTLGRVQELWPGTVGPVVAASSRPTAEHDGVLTVLCEAAVWAQELDLMAGEILPRLNQALDGATIRELRCLSA